MSHCPPAPWMGRADVASRTRSPCPGLFPRASHHAGMSGRVHDRDPSPLALLLCGFGLSRVDVHFMGEQGFPEPTFSEKGAQWDVLVGVTRVSRTASDSWVAPWGLSMSPSSRHRHHSQKLGSATSWVVPGPPPHPSRGRRALLRDRPFQKATPLRAAAAC